MFDESIRTIAALALASALTLTAPPVLADPLFTDAGIISLMDADGPAIIDGVDTSTPRDPDDQADWSTPDYLGHEHVGDCTAAACIVVMGTIEYDDGTVEPYLFDLANPPDMEAAD